LNIQRALIQSPNITVAIFKIRSLKHLILYSVNPIILHFDNNSIDPLIQLEYLDIDDCCITKFLQLLKYVGPNLAQMKIRIPYIRQQNLALIDPIAIDELLAKQRIPGKYSESLKN
jgi:hypothetical protein